MSEPPHPTCVETTVAGFPKSYVCGRDCPRPAGPDPARNARVAKRRAEDARAAGRALDRLLETTPESLGPVEAFHAGYIAAMAEARLCAWTAGGPCSCGHHVITEGV